MLLEQSKEVERLQQELAEARQQLEERRIMTEEAGSIAEAALRINRVFEAAQQPQTSTWRTSGSSSRPYRVQNPQTVRRMKAFRNEEKDQQRNHVHAYSNPAGGGIKQNKYRHRYHRVLRNTLGTLITVAATAVLIAYSCFRYFRSMAVPCTHYPGGQIVVSVKGVDFTREM